RAVGPDRSGDDQALRHRDVLEGLRAGDAGPRRHGAHQRDAALRRLASGPHRPDRRWEQRDPPPDHRPGGTGPMSQNGGEIRMLIGGKLVEAVSGKRFPNVNPATEEVLGEVADASASDMQAAIAAARRAFDDGDWATNRKLRQRCLEQLQDALEAEREEL